MRIIPVLDVQDGLVMRARFGDRASYRPIVTPVAASADPVDVATGLRRLHPFETLYVADLDGIAGGRRADAVIDRLASALPQVEIWVDNGLSQTDDARAWASARDARLVLGSESRPEAEAIAALGDRAVLSLDWRGDSFQGNPSLERDAAHWPRDVIVMTLARVGSGAGPDLERLAAVQQRAGRDRRVFAAGGVRDAGDCEALAAMGIAGALVATALHDGRLGPADLARWHGA